MNLKRTTTDTASRVVIPTFNGNATTKLLSVLLFCCIAHNGCHAFSGISFPKLPFLQTNINNNLKYDPTFVPPDCDKEGIVEELCIDTVRRMKRILVPVPSTIHPKNEIGVSYSYWSAAEKKSWPSTTRSLPPILLIHGFDSSNLEYRRLGSRLAQRGFDTYAVDLLGWGYTELLVDNDIDSNGSSIDFSANAKVVALQSFIEQVIGKGNDFVIAGASLGGAAAIETAVKSSSTNCKGLILIDAQGFVDGVGLMSYLPTPIAQLGVNVLQSVPLRSTANQMSYYDKTTYATDEAVTIGRVHTLRTGWNNALVNFMQSGGFTPSKYISQITTPTLILWGQQDTILDGTEFVPKFLSTIPATTYKTNIWIEKCGHVPHLEQPDETADAIYSFVTSIEA